jgi:RNA polymerase sigma factor (sigma-70 family)
LSPLALSLRFLQTQSDAQLAALARAGHERAFEALVRRYRRELLAYCRRVNSVGTSAEDTLQQALLQAWSAIRTGVDVRDPRAWLYRIVHNVAVSNQRRPVLVPVEVRDTAGVSGADHVAEQRMAARDALAGLAALPDLQREVMVGTAVDGMSHEELASALGLSSGAVRGLIYRARATLRAAAAAMTPGPVIAWALRTGSGGPGSGLYEALAGGGTAGLGGILVKGGAIAATAGAIATATGISASHKASHHHATRPVAAVQHRVISHPALASAASSRVLVADPTSSHFADRHGSAQQGSTSAGLRQAGTSDHGFAAVSGSRGPGERRHDGGAGRGSDDGSRDGSSGTGGQRSGHRGSGSGPGSSDDGSPSGGSGSPTATMPLGSGSGGSDDGGQLSGTAGGSSGSSGSSGGGSSLSGGGSPGTASISSDGGGGIDGGSGGDGATTTTTTATTTTTTTTSGGDGSGHHGSD